MEFINLLIFSFVAYAILSLYTVIKLLITLHKLSEDDRKTIDELRKEIIKLKVCGGSNE